MTAMVVFLSGVLAAAYLVIAGFFLKFWRQTRDRLFLYFCIAFALLAVQRTVLIDEFGLIEDRIWGYGLRLLAFLVILFGIIAKNREKRGQA
jgi:hypothetical protein